MFQWVVGSSYPVIAVYILLNVGAFKVVSLSIPCWWCSLLNMVISFSFFFSAWYVFQKNITNTTRQCNTGFWEGNWSRINVDKTTWPWTVEIGSQWNSRRSHITCSAWIYECNSAYKNCIHEQVTHQSWLLFSTKNWGKFPSCPVLLCQQVTSDPWKQSLNCKAYYLASFNESESWYCK